MTTHSEEPNILPQLDPKTIIDVATNQAVLEILSVVQLHGLTASTLRTRLSQPVLTQQNIQHYLNHCSNEQLAAHFYEAAVQKVIESAARNQAKANTQNAPIPNSTEAGSSASVPNDGESTGRN